MQTTKAQVIDLCHRYGPQLHVVAPLDGAKVLYALAGCESTWGHDTAPRHEPAYDRGGRYAGNGIMPALLAKFGSAAACSYGVWQTLAVNAPQFTPAELASDPDKQAQAVVGFLNSFVLHFRGARTLAQIAETYNSGDFSAEPSPGVLRYVHDCETYYTAPFILP